jgi:hypothetical protein
MSKSTIFVVIALISSLFLSGIVVTRATCSSSGPEVGSDANPSTTKKEHEGPFVDDDQLKQASCPITHTTVLVLIYGDAFCPVQILKSVHVIP